MGIRIQGVKIRPESKYFQTKFTCKLQNIRYFQRLNIIKFFIKIYFCIVSFQLFWQSFGNFYLLGPDQSSHHWFLLQGLIYFYIFCVFPAPSTVSWATRTSTWVTMCEPCSTTSTTSPSPGPWATGQLIQIRCLELGSGS